MSEGRADYTPCFFYQIPQLFGSTLPVDVAIIQVTKPDEHGYCSFGVGVDYIKAAAENAKVVIAQVNENMPRTGGDAHIHINEIDYIVERNVMLPETKRKELTDEEKRIGEYCAELIHDGDTLQVGIGNIPNAVLAALDGKKDLGIHSEMISDGVMDLMKKGVITNAEKTRNKGKTVASFAMGTKGLFEYLDANPSIEMHPVEYVNSPLVIMEHENMVSINSCVQIDLMGQVAAETVGKMQISGVGGLVDFVRGTAMAKNGRSVIAMTSTAMGGKISKIVPQLEAGTAVTLSRNDVDYIVTEYGIAQLRGYSLKERAKKLISVAHPKFRGKLLAEWEKNYN